MSASTDQIPTSQASQALIPRGQGLVIAFHCVPFDVEPAIEQFWADLRGGLQVHGQDLLLVSTAPVRDASIPYLSLPFHLPDVLGDASIGDGLSGENDPRLVQTLANWYRIDDRLAEGLASQVQRFIAGLFDSTRPAAVISWQSTHPLSRMARQACQSRDVPWWCAERGWLRDTLMVDLCENNGLSEVSRSLGLRRAYRRYPLDGALLDAIRRRASPGNSASRYPQDAPAGKGTLRERLGLSSDTRVYALLTHGEPHVNTVSNQALRGNHGMSQELLQAELEQIAHELDQTGAVLVVREHPFNAIHQRRLDVSGMSNVFVDTGPLDDLIDQADRFLFTLSTLQFEIALRGKPFGLLARSLLADPGEAPFIGDFTSCAEFLAAFADEAAWRPRLEALHRKVCFLYEHQLLDLTPDHAMHSARTLADLLSGCNGLPLEQALDGLQSFLSG